MPFAIASYNVLADAYLNPSWYARTSPALLAPERRGPALARRVAGLGADAVLLQEVEPARFAALGAALEPLGYEGRYLRKGGGKPDGCASFVRDAALRIREVREVRFEDGAGGAPDSGHVALALVAEHQRRRVGLANTHIRWHAPDAPPAERIGERQAALLVAALRAIEVDAWIVCGDFNATPRSEVVRTVRDGLGLLDAYGDGDEPRTCVANGRARRIDFVLFGPALAVRPLDVPAVDDGTALPAEGEPSDHVPIGARCAWRARGRDAGVSGTP